MDVKRTSYRSIYFWKYGPKLDPAFPFCIRHVPTTGLDRILTENTGHNLCLL